MSKLGFGLMRLPEKHGKIDLEQVCRMVDACLAAGMTCFKAIPHNTGGRLASEFSFRMRLAL